jgi:hypothetical protein
MTKEKVYLGKVYKLKSLENYSAIATFPRYMILTHKVYRQKEYYMTMYRYYDIGYASVSGRPISEYDITSFYKVIEEGEWQE